jgi:DNA end-binding protein Ku
MRGFHSQLTITTKIDEATGAEMPLFAFPVQICKAVENVDVKFDNAAPSGAPRKQRWLDEATGEIVTDAECIQGVRTGDSFQVIEAEQISAIDEATKLPDIRVIETVDRAAVPFDRVTDVAFLQSPTKGGSHRHYRVAFEALGSDRAMLVRYSVRTRQKLGVVFADQDQGCLLLATIRYGAEMRKPDDVVTAPQLVDLDKKVIANARKVIESLGGGEGFDAPVDEALDQKRDLIEAALTGDQIEVPAKAEAKASTEDLDAILQASIA